MARELIWSVGRTPNNGREKRNKTDDKRQRGERNRTRKPKRGGWEAKSRKRGSCSGKTR